MDKKLLNKFEEMDADERKKLIKVLSESKNSDEKKQNKLEWIYKEETVDREEYLLGRKIDSAITKEICPEKDDTNIPGALFQDVISRRSNLDMQIKMREDPLYAIRLKEEEARKRLLENPLKMKKYQMMVDKMEKEKKKKNKKEKTKHSNNSDDSETDELLKKYLSIVNNKKNKQTAKSSSNKDEVGNKKNHVNSNYESVGDGPTKPLNYEDNDLPSKHKPDDNINFKDKHRHQNYEVNEILSKHKRKHRDNSVGDDVESVSKKFKSQQKSLDNDHKQDKKHHKHKHKQDNDSDIYEQKKKPKKHKQDRKYEQQNDSDDVHERDEKPDKHKHKQQNYSDNVHERDEKPDKHKHKQQNYTDNDHERDEKPDKHKHEHKHKQQNNSDNVHERDEKPDKHKHKQHNDSDIVNERNKKAFKHKHDSSDHDDPDSEYCDKRNDDNAKSKMYGLILPDGVRKSTNNGPKISYVSPFAKPEIKINPREQKIKKKKVPTATLR